MSTTPDRITELLLQSRVTGIDFIYVHPDQLTLDVYFLRPVTSLDTPLPGTLKPGDFKIYSPESALPLIEVAAINGWTTIDGTDVLSLKTKQHGDFSLYRFLINDPQNRIDPYYNDISFSFKANCPGDLDCKSPAHECPPDELADFPIDYMARDFWSYRKALLDFAALRYPEWTDRLEADAGVMMTELMSALGDEMSYYQDRISREAYLETANQRRSVRRHARLIDYQMHDGLGAKAWLDITVDAGTVLLPAGTNVFALSDDNTRVDFEIGNGISGIIVGKTYPVDEFCNEFIPHMWDENQTCLFVGATELYLKGSHKNHLTANGLPRWVLLQTNPTDPAQEARTQLVRLIEVTDTTDPVFNENITHIVWEQEQALRFEFDLSILTIRGNIVPATAGKTHTAYFIADKSLSSLSAQQINGFNSEPSGETVNRQGHDNTDTHLFTLPYSQNQSLVYLGNDLVHYNVPEIVLEEVEFDPISNSWKPKIFAGSWEYRNTLVGISSSTGTDKHFTLDDGSWQRVVGYQRIGEEIEHVDYAMNNGVTIRFGDGEFGRVPDKGAVFRVRYRLGGTRRSNIAAATIKYFSVPLAGVSAINPLASAGGWDAESAREVRQLAPEAFRAITFRAVRPEDYAEAAERLLWVQKAGAAFRWTGSWLTAFVTPDPRGTVTLEKTERNELNAQLNRFRQAGREVNVMDPEYASIDLEIYICVSSDAYPGQVKERVFEALMGKKGLRPVQGYFSPDRFTFGTLLNRSTLEAAIQKVPGVKAVEAIKFRRRGWFGWQTFSELSYDPGKNNIIRIANDPLHPERGTIKLYSHGGL